MIPLTWFSSRAQPKLCPEATSEHCPSANLCVAVTRVSPAQYPTPGTHFPLWETLWSPCLAKELEQLKRSSCHLCLCPMGFLGHVPRVLPDNIITIYSPVPLVAPGASKGLLELFQEQSSLSHWCNAREPGNEPI